MGHKQYIFFLAFNHHGNAKYIFLPINIFSDAINIFHQIINDSLHAMERVRAYIVLCVHVVHGCKCVCLPVI